MDIDRSSHHCPAKNEAPDSTPHPIAQQKHSGTELSLTEKERRDLCDRQKARQQKAQANNLTGKESEPR